MGVMEGLRFGVLHRGVVWGLGCRVLHRGRGVVWGGKVWWLYIMGLCGVGGFHGHISWGCVGLVVLHHRVVCGGVGFMVIHHGVVWGGWVWWFYIMGLCVGCVGFMVLQHGVVGGWVMTLCCAVPHLLQGVLVGCPHERRCGVQRGDGVHVDLAQACMEGGAGGGHHERPCIPHGECGLGHAPPHPPPQTHTHTLTHLASWTA